MNAQDRNRESWIERTAELPLDYNELPARVLPPDPLIRRAGPAGRVRTVAEWREQREISI